MTIETPKTTDPAAPPAPGHDSGGKGKRHKRSGMLTRGKHSAKIRWAVGALLAAALLLACVWFFYMRGIVSSDDARFNGHMVDVAPTVGGRALRVLVKEGDPVKQGDPVFEIDSTVQRAVVAQAEAAVQAARATLAVARAKYERAVNGPRPEEIAASEAAARKLESDESLARIEWERIQGLRKEGAGTPQQLDRTAAAYESAKQSRESALQNLAMLKEGTRKDELEVARADTRLAEGRVAETEAALAKANRDLDLYSVRAPFDGHVVRRWLDPGATVQPGQPVISVFDPATLRVDANIEEKDLADVAVGDTVDIRVDAYPHLRLHGRVIDILRAANSQFSLVPAEGVSGTFIKVTQRVPLRIAVSSPPGLLLGPGLSAEVRIHSGTGNGERAPKDAHD